MNKFLYTLLLVILVLALAAGFYFTCFPQGRAMWNTYQNSLHKIDDRTTYEQRKLVEDTCRSMIASWNADILIYKQYRKSDSPEKQSWAEEALMRANKTAVTYNEYILKNSYVFQGNIPSDIYAVITPITD